MFEQDLNYEEQPSGFRLDKTRAARFLNSFKKFLEKRVSRELVTMMI